MAPMYDPTLDFSDPGDWDTLTPMLTPVVPSLPASSLMAFFTLTPPDLLSPMVIDYAYGHYAWGTSVAPPHGINTA